MACGSDANGIQSLPPQLLSVGDSCSRGGELWRRGSEARWGEGSLPPPGSPRVAAVTGVRGDLEGLGGGANLP